jgi:hypothetical protein
MTKTGNNIYLPPGASLPKTNKRCRHYKTRKEYKEESCGTRVAHYCVLCGEFVQAGFFEGKKTSELGKVAE